MKTKNLLLTACLAFGLIYFPSGKVSAQSPPPDSPNDDEDDSVRMLVKYSQGGEKRRRSHHGVMEPVGVAVGLVVEIRLDFSKETPGQTVIVAPLDGGQITAPEGPLTVAVDGTVRFRFRAGQTPGLYRLQVQGAGRYELQLYAVDPNHPRPHSRGAGVP